MGRIYGGSDARKGCQEIRFKLLFKTNQSQERPEAGVDFVGPPWPITGGRTKG